MKKEKKLCKKAKEGKERTDEEKIDERYRAVS
jgi:hypothetical protein